MDTAERIKALGRELRRRRHGLGLTLEALGKASGLSQNYLGGIELGQRDPSLSSMLRIAHGLGSAAGELLGLPEMSADAIEGARLLTSIPEPVRTPLLGTLRALAEVFRGRT